MFYDLVVWGFFEPTVQGLKSYLAQPTWLTYKVWAKYQENKVKDTNFNSMSIAKMAMVLEMGLASFGGGANKVDQNLERYLPFSWILENDVISQDTADVFWLCVEEKLIPPYVERAINLNTELINSLKAKKRG